MTLQPDGFIGAVMAMEGVTDATALLHGQSGCRKGLLLSQRMCPRPGRIVDVPVYAGCPTVPYSGLNQGDYTGKSIGKLSKALAYVAGEDYNLVAVICSPGISIVGDDCADAVRERGLGDSTIVLENDDLGTEAHQGFDHAVAACIRRLRTGERRIVPGTVTVLGLSIMHKDWLSVREELDDVFGILGLSCVCYAGAGCTTAELRDSVNSEFYVDLAPEFTEKTRAVYDELGVTGISTGVSPVGFDAAEDLYMKIAESTGGDADKVRALVSSYKRRAYRCVCAVDTDMRGRTFCVSAPPSVKEPLKRFMEESFSMVYSDTDYDVLFADGNRCVMERASKKCGRCVDIGFPSNKVDFSCNPVMGLRGTMYLLDSLFG